MKLLDIGTRVRILQGPVVGTIHGVGHLCHETEYPLFVYLVVLDEGMGAWDPTGDVYFGTVVAGLDAVEEV